MRRVSKTNRRWNAPGRARPDEPLADWCEANIEGVCTGRATDRHHVIPRGPGSSDEAWNTRDLCRACHQHVETHRPWAEANGLLAKRPPVDPMAKFTLGSVVLVAAVCWGLLALGGCGEGDAGQEGVCSCPDGCVLAKPWARKMLALLGEAGK